MRLDGPVARRVPQAIRLEGIDEKEASLRRAEIDRARALFVKRFYGADLHDPGLYHLVVDSTVVPLDRCADLLVTAATGAWSRVDPG